MFRYRRGFQFAPSFFLSWSTTTKQFSGVAGGGGTMLTSSPLKSPVGGYERYCHLEDVHHLQLGFFFE